MSWRQILPPDFSSKIGHFFLVVILMALTGLSCYWYAAYHYSQTQMEFIMKNGAYIKGGTQ